MGNRGAKTNRMVRNVQRFDRMPAHLQYRTLGRSLMILLSFCFMMGCQLARPDGEASQIGSGVTNDRLVGVYVTREHLNLFDMDDYLQDNIKDVENGEEHVIRDGEAYEGRLYAELVTRTFTSEDGLAYEHQEYIFKDLKGMGLYSVLIRDEEGEYYTSISGGGISDVHVGHHSKDTEEDISLEGVIYVSAMSKAVQQGDTVFYFNPVYQTPEGQVYLMSGSGLDSMSLSEEGTSMSHNMNETVTTDANGEEKSFGCNVTVEIQSVIAPEKLVVVQMSAENTVLQQTEYIPGQLPKALVPKEEVAYLLVESWKKDGDSQWIVDRKVCQQGEKKISVLHDRGDGICEEEFLSIQWPDEKHVK